MWYFFYPVDSVPQDTNSVPEANPDPAGCGQFGACA